MTASHMEDHDQTNQILGCSCCRAWMSSTTSAQHVLVYKIGLQRIEAVIQELKRQTHEGTPALNLRCPSANRAGGPG